MSSTLIFQLTQFDKDSKTGDLTSFVLETLQKDSEFRQHEKNWDIIVSVEMQNMCGTDSDNESNDDYDVGTVSTQYPHGVHTESTQYQHGIHTESTQRPAQPSRDSGFESGECNTSTSCGDRATTTLNSDSMRPPAIREEPSSEREEGSNAPHRRSPRQNPNTGNLQRDEGLNSPHRGSPSRQNRNTGSLSRQNPNEGFYTPPRGSPIQNTNTGSLQTDATRIEDSRQRALIAHQVIQMHISSNDYTAKDFYQLLDSNIKKGVNVSELRDTQGLTILHEVAIRDRSDLFTVFYDLGIMLEMSKKRVSSRESQFYDMTPLAVAEQLRTKGRDELESFIQKDKNITKLCKYARLGQLDKMQEIISRNPVSVHNLSEGDGSYPIYWACVANSRPAIELLLSAGAHFNIVLKDKERILPKVCSLGHLDLAVHLMKTYKLDPNETGLGDKSPIERVSETGDFKLLQQLFKHGAQFSRLILHAAAKYGQVAFIQKMMTSYGDKLDVNAKDPAGRTPIFHAADNAHVPAMQVLNISCVSTQKGIFEMPMGLDLDFLVPDNWDFWV